jgi:hypothetical protein
MYSSRDFSHPAKHAKVTQKHFCVRARRTRTLGGLGHDIGSHSLTSYVTAKTAKE